MALNPNDFIFHSELLYEQRIEKKTLTVSVSGSIAAGATSTWASAWQDISYGATGVRGTVYIPGTVYVPSASNGTFQLPVNLIYDNSYYLNFYVRVQVQNNRYRALVESSNPYGFAVSSPNRTFTLNISTYLPQ